MESDTISHASGTKRRSSNDGANLNVAETKRKRSSWNTMPGSSSESVSIDSRYATHNDVHRDQYNVTYNNRTSESREMLASLKPVDRGGYYVPPCMNGTREDVFEEIDQWLHDVNAPNVLWLSGSPGAGKSAIASSLVSKLTERGRLGSRFFLKRGDITLSDPASVWRTVAWDLAEFDPVFANNLVTILKARKVNPGIPDIALHFKYLIGEPLSKSYDQSLSHAIPVIVIDAIDESHSEGPQIMQRKALMDTLSDWSRLSKMFKLIITGRNERIPGSFHAICKQMILSTGEGVSANANLDIRRFFESRFDDLGSSSLPDWPGNHVLDALTVRAAGLFIWAQTVVKFVSQGLPEEQLDLVLAGDLGDEDNITKLYQQILEFSFGGAKERTLEVFRLVVSTIILSKLPLRSGDLHYFILQPRSSTTFILDKLSSVISITGEQKYLRIGHLSFSEFLCDCQRCPKEFYIDRETESQKLATACFRLMRLELMFNICELETSHYCNDDIEDLPQRITRKISMPLLYACRFWVAHLLEAPEDLEAHHSLLKEVEDFLHIRLLFWLEVMSLMKEVAVANIALLTVAPWLQGLNAKLAALVRDFSRFIVTFDIPISKSTPHIYLSALPFAPQKCLTAKQYQSKFPNTLSVVSGGLLSWPAGTNIFRGHSDHVQSVSFSQDSKHVVSGSRDGTVRIWDVDTGQTIAGPLRGHTGWVNSVSFSPDGTQIVSGSADCTACVWDIITGQRTTGSFEGHTNWINSVTFSPNGKQVASGSSDCTVCLWNAETGQATSSPFKGHTDWVNSVVYSPDGRKIASGSRDYTVRVWDVATGQTISSPFRGHTYWVNSVIFSPGGKQLVSGSADGTVRMWNVKTCQTVSGPFLGHTDSVTSVAFASEARWVISGSRDGTVRIWNAETGQAIASPFEGHTYWVTSVTCSQNGKQVVSGSGDDTVRVWDVETIQTIAVPSKGHKDQINSVAFSPDGKQVVSGSADRTIRIWDVETGQTTAGPFRGPALAVTSVAFLPDGKRVFSGSDDGVRIWNIQTGKIIEGPFEADADWVNSLAFSPDGEQLVSGAQDGSVTMWNAQTGQTTAGPFTGHTGVVTSVGFSPNGKQVVSASNDCTIRVWNVETGWAIAGIFSHRRDVLSSLTFPLDAKISCTLTPSQPTAHIQNLISIGGGDTLSNLFNGWVNLKSQGRHHKLLFWVPLPCQDALCGIETVIVLGKHTSRLDLSQFVHGKSWTQCYSC